MPSTRHAPDPFTDAPGLGPSRARAAQHSRPATTTAPVFSSSSSTAPGARSNLFSSNLSRRLPATQAVNMRFNNRADRARELSNDGGRDAGDQIADNDTIPSDLSDVDEDSLLGHAHRQGRVQRPTQTGAAGARAIAGAATGTATRAGKANPTRRGGHEAQPRHGHRQGAEMHLDTMRDEEEDEDDEEAPTITNDATVFNTLPSITSRAQRTRGRSQSTRGGGNRSQEPGYIENSGGRRDKDIVLRDAKGGFLHEIPEPNGTAEERQSEDEQREIDANLNTFVQDFWARGGGTTAPPSRSRGKPDEEELEKARNEVMKRLRATVHEQMSDEKWRFEPTDYMESLRIATHGRL